MSVMKTKKILPLALLIGIAAIATADILSDNGKAGKTGSPGETTCTNCHNSYSVNTGGGSISISSSNMMNWKYVPGQTYHMSVTVSRSANSLFGFGFEALKATGNTPAGTLVVTNNASTTIKSATISSVVRPNIVHTLNGGASAGSKVFNFDWTAPSSDVGNIIFYAAGNACNNNGDEFGDYVYTTSQTVSPASTTGIADLNYGSNHINAYPNPVYQDLTVEYSLENPSRVQVSVLNLKGEIVLNLLNETQFGGFYTQEFNLGNKLAKGVYMLSVQTENKRELKKIIVQ